MRSRTSLPAAHRAKALALAAFAATTGCALVVGFPDRSEAPGDVGDAGGDALETSTHDALVDTRDTSTTETSIDAFDANETIAVDSNDADAGTFCTGKTGIFCDDFESGSLDLWPTNIGDPPTSATIDDVIFAPPAGHALRIDSPSGGDVVYLEKPVPKTLQHVALTFDIHPDVFAASATYVARVGLGSYYALIHVTGGSTNVHQLYPDGTGGSAVWSSSTIVTLPSGKWTRVALVVDVPTKTVEMDFNGSAVSSDALVTGWGAASASFAIGVIHKDAGTDATTIHYDDVTFEGT